LYFWEFLFLLTPSLIIDGVKQISIKRMGFSKEVSTYSNILLNSNYANTNWTLLQQFCFTFSLVIIGVMTNTMIDILTADLRAVLISRVFKLETCPFGIKPPYPYSMVWYSWEAKQGNALGNRVKFLLSSIITVVYTDWAHRTTQFPLKFNLVKINNNY
jgi:hypothetical protein